MSDLNTDNNQTNMGVQGMGTNKRFPKILIIVVVGVLIIGGLAWGYSSGIFNFLGINKNTSNNNVPAVTLPPLTEAQKPETAQAPEGMVYVPEGEYLSGAPNQEVKKWPEQKIYLDSFSIDKHEVTKAQFQEFISSHSDWQKSLINKSLAYREYLSDFNGNVAPSDKLDHPVAWVSWYAANAYCEALGKKLPTSWQWEKAARGTDGRIYPWGNDLTKARANYCDTSCRMPWRDTSGDDGFSNTSPVGSFKAGISPYGAFDMAGNVLEWVADWYDKSEEYYSHISPRNPSGPANSTNKVLRGGGWIHNKTFVGLQSFIYFEQEPAEVFEYVGFRCAKDVK